MRKQHWPKRDPIKNYFPLPNEIYQLGLSPRAIAVTATLLSIEDRQTYEAYASYNTIGECDADERKHGQQVCGELEERQLISTEHTTITTQDGRRRNGCLRYHILPIQLSIDQFYETQLDRVDRVRERQAGNRRRHRGMSAIR